jgi:mercuric ion transport protein
MENQNKNSKGAVATGIIAALAASSCCIPPVIAAIAGVGGAAGSLSWMEPLRPYLIGLAVVAIGYAWYNHLKPKKEDDCGCDIEKPKWYQTKGFLIGMTLFAAVSITFPYYSGIFYPDNKQEVVIVDSASIQKINVSIEGMTCDACQNHVNHAVNELTGIVDVNTSYANGNATVQFDNTKTSVDEIKEAINSTGYTATKVEEGE